MKQSSKFKDITLLYETLDGCRIVTKLNPHELKGIIVPHSTEILKNSLKSKILRIF